MRPVVSATTERIYAALPQAYRDGDEMQPEGSDGYPLLRFLSLIGDLAGEIETIADRADYVPPRDGGAPGDTSDLADPATVDPAWLPWLAMHPGVDITAMTVGEARGAIAANRFNSASHDHLLDAVRIRLSGLRRAALILHVGGDPWVLGVTVHPDDLATVSWLALEAGFPSWGAIEAVGSWEALGDVDPIATAAVRAAKPAGVELVEVPWP